MSLANFFDKAALGASTILKNFNRHLFIESLERRSVGIFFDSEGAQSSEGKIALELSVNLLARLYPRLAIHGVGNDAHLFRKALISLAQQINPQIVLQEQIEDAHACLVVGNSSPDI